MTIYIGAFYPDSDLSNSSIGNAITRVASNLVKLGLPNDNANIELQFLMPGKHEKPKFNGMRLHSFNRGTKTLKIESSVPEHLIHSTLAGQYVIASLKDATDNASEFFKEEAVPFNAELYHQSIDKIE